MEEPGIGRDETVAHIGQSGVGVIVGVTVFVGVTVGVTIGQLYSSIHIEQSPNCSTKVAKSSVYDIRIDAGVDDETLVIHPLNNDEDK